MSTTVITRAAGRFHFTENGVARPMKSAFPLGCLLGVHLSLSRALGASEVFAYLFSDGEERGLPIPLSLVSGEGGREEYAALADTSRISRQPGLFTLTVTVDTPLGRLFVHPCGEGEVRLSPDEASLCSLLLFEKAQTGAGGASFFLPYAKLPHTGALCRGEDGDFDRFFSHLAAHGVRTLFLLLPAQGEASLCDEGLTIPPAVLETASAHGITCLFDLLPFICLHRAGRLPDERDPIGYRLCDGEGVDAAACPAIADPISPLSLFGDGGILSRALDGGYGGVFLRYADRFSDPFLCALRAELDARWGDGAPFVACHACTDLTLLPRDRLRRFEHGTVKGLLSYTLKNALLDYLASGTTDLLAAFVHTMAALPSPLLTHTAHPLDEVDGARFEDLLSSLLSAEADAPPLSELLHLAELIAATVTGTPALPAREGGEDSFAYRLRLYGICRRERALLTGELSLHTLRPDLLVFSRKREGEMLAVVINRSPDTLVLSSREGFSVLFGGRGRKAVHRLPPYSGTVLRFSLFAGEKPSLSLQRHKHIARDTRFAPRKTVEQKSS